MKKLLGISLIAMMSVTAANANIASKQYVDTKVNSLDTNELAESNQFVRTITETDGIVSATFGQIGNADVADNAAIADSKIARTGAIAENNTNIPTGGAVWTAVEAAKTANTTAINGLNLTTVGDGTSNVILTVGQAGGQVSATAGQITDNFVATNANIADSKIARSGTIAQNDTNIPTGGAVWTAINTETTNRTNADNAINAKIGDGFDGDNTVADAIAAVQNGVDGLNLTDAEADGNGVVTSVTQTEGQIAVTKADPLTTMDYTAVAGNDAPGQYVLTKTIGNGGAITYNWELVARTGTESLPQQGE